MSQSQYSGIHMLMPSKYLMLILSLVCVSLNIANAGQVVRITPAQIKTLGIETSPIQANANANSQRLPGEIVVPVDQARIISAPQSGLIDQMLVATGSGACPFKQPRFGRITARPFASLIATTSLSKLA